MPIPISLLPPKMTGRTPSKMTAPVQPAKALASSRSTSLAGHKRQREAEESPARAAARRTKSTSDALAGARRDDEAYKRGMIRVFVASALTQVAKGQTEHYTELVSQFSPTPTTPIPDFQPLVALLRALASNASNISLQLHRSLITAILGLPWAIGDDRFVKSYIGWTGVLVSAHPECAAEVLTKLVKGLTWQHAIRSSMHSPLPRRLVYARHHLLLSHLLTLIPTLPTILQPLLVKFAPHKREPEVAQTTWLRNVCEMIRYCPELSDRIWLGLVDRMLRIDLEITSVLDDDSDAGDSDVEEDDQEDRAFHVRIDPITGLSHVTGPPPTSVAPDPFDLLFSEDLPKPQHDDDSDSDMDDVDLDDIESDQESLSDDDERVDLTQARRQLEKRRAAIKEMRTKLDGMLVHFFEHLRNVMGANSDQPATAIAGDASLTPASTPSSSSFPSTFYSCEISAPSDLTPSLIHFQTLLTIFSRLILPTAATQHLPFVLFLTASISPRHTDLFLGLLVSTALYPGSTSAVPTPMVHRVASAVYIGSAVCRARFVDDAQAKTVMGYLLAYIDGKLIEAGSGVSLGEELPLFYAVCQAAMLIFCFRWKAFQVDEVETESESGLEMEGIAEPLAPTSRWMADMDVLQKALTSSLNPLMGCNSVVVDTFAKVAHHTNFAYCFSIIQANQTPSLSASASSTSLSLQRTATRSATQHDLAPATARQINIDSGLDSYFPFDPYDLRRSKRWIQKHYRSWGDVGINLGGDESSDEDEDEASEAAGSDSEDEVDRGMPRAKPVKIGSFGKNKHLFDNSLSTSLEGMSISPLTTMEAR